MTAQVRLITGREFETHRATLLDYERIAPPRGYPYVVPRPGGLVEGLLLVGLDEGAVRALDDYEDEGHLYHRRRAKARVDGRERRCAVYVGNTDVLVRAFGE